MKHSNNNHRHFPRYFAVAGLLAALSMPTLSSAAEPALPHEVTPIAAEDDDPPCEESIVALTLDVENGLVYLVNSDGSLTLTDNDLNIYFGSLTSVVMDLEFTSGEWEVEVSPSGGTTELYYTRGGSTRFAIDDTPVEYVLSFTELGGSTSTMMNMAPILPDVIIQPDKDCPPPT